MINRENNNKDIWEDKLINPQEQPTDTAIVEVDAHITIRDLDTQEVLLDRRG